MAKLMGLREYARHRKVTLRAVQQAIAAGRILTAKDPLSGKQMIDPAAADAAWGATTDFTRIPVRSKAGVRELEDPGISHGEIVSEPIVEDEDDDQPENDSRSMYKSAKRFAAARADKEEIMAQRALLELKRKAGELVPASEVRKAVFARARSTRDAILALPSTINHELAAESDPIKVSIILEKAIRDAFCELCGPEPEDED